MNWKRFTYITAFVFLIGACKSNNKPVPTVGFVDAFEDATIAQAKDGFVDALKEGGYSEEKNTIKVLYKNAQGDIPALTQIVNYYLSEKVDLMATSTTLSTLTALQRTQTVPVFMMVSPVPERMKILDAAGKPPVNLYGVAEELAYIDTSFTLIPKMLKPKGAKLIVGMIYNQAEPQSADALERIRSLARQNNIQIEALPLNTTAEAQIVTQSLLNKNIDAFFANPDNTVFAAFETILKNCNQQNIPIFTSEAGLVKRGAVAAFGADIYQWGHQAGEQAVKYLKSGKTEGLRWEMVKVRKRVYNPEAVKKYNISIPEGFEAVK
ncbi:ABC transporter substrate-binding protein [Desertivirga arenae]|uniref:ABC transporter substrate-binding protein n=1 Tax=Desertivirga arenae TaxID=2810309 RepID=UPI001A964E47|nr:ABC transporter substrate-binding protein [Pedobacter sp. SYSU D00823]